MDTEYALYDFTETISGENIKPEDISKVVKAWGNGIGTEWSGGFVLKLKKGGYCYVTGWNDYTGWGCQDGTEITYGKTLKDLNLPKDQKMESNPIDLNLWIKDPNRKQGWE